MSRKQKRKASNSRIAELFEKLKKRKAIILYGLTFFAALIVFAWIANLTWFETMTKSVLDVYASLSNVILVALGQETTAISETIKSENYSINIKQGCDAIAPMLLYIVAVLAFPISMKYKWQGIIGGVIVLFLFNTIRIVSLYLIGAYANSFFDFAHIELWQVIFIVLTVYTWLMWMKWAQGQKSKNEIA